MQGPCDEVFPEKIQPIQFYSQNTLQSKVLREALSKKNRSIRTIGYIFIIFTMLSTIDVHANTYLFYKIDPPFVPIGYLRILTAINNSGQIVGWYVDTDSDEHAFLYNAGEFSKVETENASIKRAQDITDTNLIVGWCENMDGHHGFLLDGDSFNIIDYPGATRTDVNAINENGNIVGRYDGFFGFLYDPITKGFSTFDCSPGSGQTDPKGNNDSGWILGDYNTSSGDGAFLYEDSTCDPIAFPGAVRTSASDINNDGVIVGSYDDGTNWHGYLYDFNKGTFISIDFPNATKTYAYGINDAGQIVGYYLDSSGYHGFLATPVTNIDNEPYFVDASLQSSVVLPNLIYFTGNAKDDNGLKSISMSVSGPSGEHTVFTDNISGTSKSLSQYYFNSADINYANIPGSYTVTLTLMDIANQIKEKNFNVTVIEMSSDIASTFEFPLHSGSYYLSQDFGVWNTDSEGYHLGEDYTVSNGEELPVYAPANGVVKHNTQRTRYGYVVIIEHTTEDFDTKVCSVLGHLRADGIISVETKVSKGQLIGYLSNDYNENGGYNFTHLHFGIRHGSYTSTWVYNGYGDESDRENWWDPSNFLAMHKEEHITWNFCNNADVSLGWQVQHGTAGICQGSSWIIDPADGTDKDPAIKSPEYDTYNSLYINPLFYDHIEIHMSSNLNNRNAKIYWTSSNYPNISEAQSQSLNISGNPGDWDHYCWDLSNNPQWLFNGRIQWLRFDFGDTGDASGEDVCAVDYIRLTNGLCPNSNDNRRNHTPWIPLLLLDD